MRVFAEVRLLACSKKSFTSNDGEYVEYHEIILKGEEGTLELNAKADYTAVEGMSGIAEIEAQERDDGKGFKLTLKKFSTGEKLDLPEEEIA